MLHTEALAFDHAPPSQLMQADEPASERLPASHEAHKAAPVDE